jgi:hypothetical protein
VIYWRWIADDEWWTIFREGGREEVKDWWVDMEVLECAGKEYIGEGGPGFWVLNVEILNLRLVASGISVFWK